MLLKRDSCMKSLLNGIKIIAILLLCIPKFFFPLSRAMQASKSYQIKQLTPEQRKMLAQKAVLMKAKFKDSELLSMALDKIAHGTFDQYYWDELKLEYDASLKDKNVQSRLRTLINLAEKQSDKSLSAFLTTYFFAKEMLQMLSPV